MTRSVEEERLREAVRLRLAAYMESHPEEGYKEIAAATGSSKNSLTRILKPGALRPNGERYELVALPVIFRIVDWLGVTLAELVPDPRADEGPYQWHDIDAALRRLAMPDDHRRLLADIAHAAHGQIRKWEINERLSQKVVGAGSGVEERPAVPVAVAAPAPEPVAAPVVEEPQPELPGVERLELPDPEPAPEESPADLLGIGGEWTWLIPLCAGSNASATVRSDVAAFLSRDWELIQAEVDKADPPTEKARNAAIKAMAIRYWRQEARRGSYGASDTSQAVADALDGF